MNWIVEFLRWMYLTPVEQLTPLHWVVFIAMLSVGILGLYLLYGTKNLF